MRLNKFHVLLALTILGYTLFEYYRPRPVNWTPTYANKDKIPYGTRALFGLLPEVFPGQPVRTLRVPLSEALHDPELPGESSYISISRYYDPGEGELEALFDYVENGGYAFISALSFPDSLLHRLSLDMEDIPGSKTAHRIRFENQQLSTPYAFPKSGSTTCFKVLDIRHATLLGTNEYRRPVHLKVKFGRGSFFLHCIPVAFTNYYLLSPGTASYAFEALSYLPVAPVYWDEYQKQGRIGSGNSSVLRYIAATPALKAAWYVAVFGLLAYVLFAGKRKQRVIPVIAPPKNASLEFIKTVGNLYFLKGDHAHAAQKRTQYFNMYIRDKMGINADVLPQAELAAQLASKSGLPRGQIETLLSEMDDVQHSDHLSRAALISLNGKIEAFYRHTR